MLSTKAYRSIAIAAVFSFLIPPMLFVTFVAFWAVFSGGISNMFRHPGNWLLVGPFVFALVTCFWASHSQRVRLCITVTNLLILLCCVALGLAMLFGLTPGPRT
jgi:hypothetical protein